MQKQQCRGEILVLIQINVSHEFFVL